MTSEICQKFGYAGKVPDELVVVTKKSQKCSYLLSILWGFISLIAAALEDSGLMSVVLRTWSKY